MSYSRKYRPYNKIFAGIVLLLAVSCATLPKEGRRQTIFRGDEFSMMGDIHYALPELSGSYSYVLKESSLENVFLLTDHLGSSYGSSETASLAEFVIDVLKGGSTEVIKKIKKKDEGIIYIFSGNYHKLKQMRVLFKNSEPVLIKLKFKKGFADINITDIVYAE